ncbi:hypothetical protein ACFQ3Z_21760 [Streptomyces nogalater]
MAVEPPPEVVPVVPVAPPVDVVPPVAAVPPVPVGPAVVLGAPPPVGAVRRGATWPVVPAVWVGAAVVAPAVARLVPGGVAAPDGLAPAVAPSVGAAEGDDALFLCRLPGSCGSGEPGRWLRGPRRGRGRPRARSRGPRRPAGSRSAGSGRR